MDLDLCKMNWSVKMISSYLLIWLFMSISKPKKTNEYNHDSIIIKDFKGQSLQMWEQDSPQFIIYILDVLLLKRVLKWMTIGKIEQQ